MDRGKSYALSRLQMIPIIIFGANGFVGGHLRQEASTTGLKCLSVVRSPDNIVSMPAERVAKFDEVGSQIVGSSDWCGATIVNLIGPTQSTSVGAVWGTIVDTAKHIVELARGTNCGRIIYISGFGVSDHTTSAYFAAKSEAEDLIQNASIPYDILRCSYILGKGDELTPFIVEQLQAGTINVPGNGLYRLQPLLVTDVVKVLVCCSQQGNMNCSVQNLLGEKVSYLELIKLLRSELGSTAEIQFRPIEMFIRDAIFSLNPRFTLEELAILTCDKVGVPTQRLFDVELMGN